MLKKYPEINRLVVESLDEGLDAVISGQADFYLGNLAAINYKLKERNIAGLKAVGSIYDSEFLLTMGVKKGDKVLLSILQKALNTMPEEERQRIYNRWIQLEVISKPDYSHLTRVISISAIVIVSLVLLLWWLQRQRKKQGEYIHQVNELSMATYTNMETRNIEWVSDSFLDLTGCAKSEVLNHSHEIFKHPVVPDRFYEDLYDTVSMGKSWVGELQARACSGEDYWVEATVTPEF